MRNIPNIHPGAVPSAPVPVPWSTARPPGCPLLAGAVQSHKVPLSLLCSRLSPCPAPSGILQPLPSSLRDSPAPAQLPQGFSSPFPAPSGILQPFPSSVPCPGHLFQTPFVFPFQLLDLFIQWDWSTYLADYGQPTCKYLRVNPTTALILLEKMRDTSRKNNVFAQFRKNERDKQKLIDTVAKQLRGLINSHHS
uniref:Exocyst complex component 6 n=1 Tax=Serinus canaria TaxID=9135 RepID=A0A8C9NP24_SERCA